MRRRVLRGTVALALALAGCGGSDTPGGPGASEVRTLRLQLLADSLRVGEATQAVVTARGAGDVAVRVPEITWSSTDPAVASVRKDGTVTALAVGRTEIVAQAGSVQATTTLRVVPVRVSGVILSQLRVVLAPGASQRLAATAVDAAGRPLPNYRVQWLSSDTARVAVSDSGVVTAIAPGLVSVVAIADSAFETVDVRVSGPPGPVARVTVTPGTASLSLGDSLSLVSLQEDAIGNVANRPVTWSSSDPSVAVVSTTGVVRPLKVGRATITARADGVAGVAEIGVVDPADAITITIGLPYPDDLISDTLTIDVGVTSRHEIVKVEGGVTRYVRELEKYATGALGTGKPGWKGKILIEELPYGPYEVVVTATDAQGRTGVATRAIRRGAREGKGGTKVPPRSR